MKINITNLDRIWRCLIEGQATASLWAPFSVSLVTVGVEFESLWIKRGCLFPDRHFLRVVGLRVFHVEHHPLFCLLFRRSVYSAVTLSHDFCSFLQKLEGGEVWNKWNRPIRYGCSIYKPTEHNSLQKRKLYTILC